APENRERRGEAGGQSAGAAAIVPVDGSAQPRLPDRDTLAPERSGGPVLLTEHVAAEAVCVRSGAGSGRSGLALLCLQALRRRSCVIVTSLRRTIASPAIVPVISVLPCLRQPDD